MEVDLLRNMLHDKSLFFMDVLRALSTRKNQKKNKTVKKIFKLICDGIFFFIRRTILSM